MTIHELKTWPEPFELIRLGVKRTEVRADGPAQGRARFSAGDVLVLREWSWATGNYTGRRLTVVVRQILRLWETPEPWGLRSASVVVMEIELVRASAARFDAGDQS